MPARDNTASDIPVITDSMLCSVDIDSDTVLSGSEVKDKDQIIRELVAQVKKQHRIIHRLNEKLQLDNKEKGRRSNKISGSDRNDIDSKYLESTIKDKLINRIHENVEKKQVKLKKRFGKLSSLLSGATKKDDASLDKTFVDVSEFPGELRRTLDEQFKDEVVRQIKDDLRKELMAELKKMTTLGVIRKMSFLGVKI